MTSIPADEDANLPSDGNLAEIHLSTRRNAPIYSSTLKFTHRRVAACEAVFGHMPPPAVSPAADEPLQPPTMSLRHRKTHPFPYYFLINPFFAFLFVSLVVYFVYILIPMQEKLSAKATSVSSWVILAFRRAIDVILPTLIATSSPLMSLSLRIPPPLQHILLFRMSYLFLLSYHLQISLLHLRML